MARRMSKMARMEMVRPDRTRDAESRFRDRRGREHYDNGRFAPMRNDTNIEIEGQFRDDRSGYAAPGMRYAMEPESRNYRRDDMGRFRSDYDADAYGPQSREDWDRRDGTRMAYPGRPFPVYRQSDGMRGGGYDMNTIGFDANREWASDRYGMNAGYEMRNEMDRRPGMRMSGGHASGADGGMVEPMTKEKAERWVHSMKSANGSTGQHWTMDQAKQIMSRYGYQADPVEFYVVLNMMKSDYAKVAQKMGVDKEEFYACMADAFLNDTDVHHDKLARYYEYIAKH